MSNGFQPRKQEAPVLRTLSVLLYGVPKVGKTTEAAKFPGAVLLNCEPSGTDLLKGAHEIVDVGGLDHLDRMTRDIIASPYRTIVLDGFTWMINQGAREKVKEMGEKNRMRAFALITDQTQRVLGDILRGGKIVIATGHSRIVDDEEVTDKVEVRPDINPALSNGVFGLFSIIAYCYPTRDGSRMLTKPEDNEKRRILAGDRSGILPKVMPLSATALMEALKATQASAATGQPGNGSKGTQPAPELNPDGESPTA